MDVRHLQWLMGKLRFRWRTLMASQQEQCALLGKVVPLRTLHPAAAALLAPGCQAVLAACGLSSKGCGFGLWLDIGLPGLAGADWLGTALRWRGA